MVRPTIRLARDDEGEDIRHILGEVGQIPKGLNWTEVNPSWLVAEYRGVLVGCVQTLIGKPLGHIGFLAVLPGYQNNRHGFGYFLWKAAERVLANSGCDGYTATTAIPQVAKRLTRLGGVVYGEPCRVFFKRVQTRKEQVYGRRRHDQIHYDS